MTTRTAQRRHQRRNITLFGRTISLLKLMGMLYLLGVLTRRALTVVAAIIPPQHWSAAIIQFFIYVL